MTKPEDYNNDGEIDLPWIVDNLADIRDTLGIENENGCHIGYYLDKVKEMAKEGKPIMHERDADDLVVITYLVSHAEFILNRLVIRLSSQLTKEEKEVT